ncbi:hypothetical protein GCM10027040_29990 [Halomonas shantousis]
MDSSINNAVSAALAMQQAQVATEAQTKLMKTAMDTQASQVSQLMASVTPTDQLATEGSVGTRINTFA